MARHGILITEDNEFHASTRNGYIHTTQVAQETYLSVIVRAHH